jgi:ribose transport system substrate-binding protein
MHQILRNPPALVGGLHDVAATPALVIQNTNCPYTCQCLSYNETMGQKDPYLVEAGAKILDVLRLFQVEQGEASLKDIVRQSGMVKSTAFRMLYTLERKGYIERIPASNSYRRRTRHRVGFASISSTLPFAIEINRGIQAEASQYDIELLMKYNNFDPQLTMRNAEELLASGVDLIIEYNTDEYISHVIADRCARAHVPVIAITFPVAGATTFGINNYRAGLTGGEGLGEYLMDCWQGRLDRVVLLDTGTSPAQQARMTGMVDGLRKFVAVPEEIMSYFHVHPLEDAGQIVKCFLAQNPRSKRIVILCYNDVKTLNALQAVRAAHRTSHVLILGQGGVAEVRRQLKQPDGCLWGAVAHYPERFGVNLMPLVMRMLRGEYVPNVVWTPHTLLMRSTPDRHKTSW